MCSGYAPPSPTSSEWLAHRFTTGSMSSSGVLRTVTM